MSRRAMSSMDNTVQTTVHGRTSAPRRLREKQADTVVSGTAKDPKERPARYPTTARRATDTSAADPNISRDNRQKLHPQDLDRLHDPRCRTPRAPEQLHGPLLRRTRQQIVAGWVSFASISSCFSSPSARAPDAAPSDRTHSECRSGDHDGHRSALALAEQCPPRRDPRRRAPGRRVVNGVVEHRPALFPGRKSRPHAPRSSQTDGARLPYQQGGASSSPLRLAICQHCSPRRSSVHEDDVPARQPPTGLHNARSAAPHISGQLGDHVHTSLFPRRTIDDRRSPPEHQAIKSPAHEAQPTPPPFFFFPPPPLSLSLYAAVDSSFIGKLTRSRPTSSSPSKRTQPTRYNDHHRWRAGGISTLLRRSAGCRRFGRDRVDVSHRTPPERPPSVRTHRGDDVAPRSIKDNTKTTCHHFARQQRRIMISDAESVRWSQGSRHTAHR